MVTKEQTEMAIDALLSQLPKTNKVGDKDGELCNRTLQAAHDIAKRGNAVDYFLEKSEEAIYIGANDVMIWPFLEKLGRKKQLEKGLESRLMSHVILKYVRPSSDLNSNDFYDRQQNEAHAMMTSCLWLVKEKGYSLSIKLEKE